MLLGDWHPTLNFWNRRCQSQRERATPDPGQTIILSPLFLKNLIFFGSTNWWCGLVLVFFTDPCKTQANLKSFSRKIKTLNLQIQTQAFGNSVAFVGAKAWDTVVELVTRPDPTQADGDWGLKPKSGPYNSTESEWTGVMGQVVNGKHHICLTQWIMNPPRYENQCLNFTSIRKPTKFQSSWGSKSISYVICRPWLGPFK